MKKNSVITLSNNPLSHFSDDLYCRVKYRKLNKENETENIVLKVLESKSVSIGLFYKFALDLETHCYCSHDCCGHYFSYITSLKRISKNKYFIKLAYARNY